MSGAPGLLLALALLPGCAAIAVAGEGRLLATGGASQIEGSAGGGLVPWAVVAGYGAEGEAGCTAFLARADTGDYLLEAGGVAWSWDNRVELSLARQRFDLGELQRRLDLPFHSLGQDVLGAKLRVAGDLVYTRMPQVSMGVQHKRMRDGTLPLALGAEEDHGTDVYLSATKLFLDAAGGYQLLVNGTVRSTRANQAGLLGFGGDRRSTRSLMVEGSLAVLLDPSWAVGVEFRQKPDNLGFAPESHWRDVFVAWFPAKRVALVAAWVDLGGVATLPNQQAAYLSLQLSY